MNEPTTAETCDVCGFEWDSIGPDDVTPRLTAAITAWTQLLDERTELIASRPTPQRWSTLEYGAHVRDVLFNIRDRIFVALAEDDPVTKPMYRDLRIPFYADETATETADGLRIAAALFARTFDGLTPQQLDRPLVAGYPRQTSRTVLWFASQALHETEHHLADAHENTDR